MFKIHFYNHEEYRVVVERIYNNEDEACCKNVILP